MTDPAASISMLSDGLAQQIPDEFDALWYLQTYADVRLAGLDPWEHYQREGRAEGRQPGPVQALELDHLLWRGHADMAVPLLQSLLRSGPAREAALAGWALARWYLDQGEVKAAHAALLKFHDHPEGAQSLAHAGPFLLAVQLCLTLSDDAGADRILRAGLRRFGPLPDFLLAEMLCRKAKGAARDTLNDLLAGIYLPHDLAPVEITGLPGPLFDRLQCDPGPWPRQVGSDQPLVSVILPVFNAAAGLPTALRGLLAQSWQALEILIVDDGSSDDSLAIAQAAALRDPRIRVLPLGQNCGAYAARNAGFAAATGAFITVHDADDWSHPQKIERQVQPLIMEDSLQATVSHWVRAGNDLQMTRWRMEDRWIYRNVSSLMLRAGLRDSLGYWDRVRVNADTEYYYRIIAAYGAAGIHEVLPGVPLAFGRSDPRSLTLQSATHLRSQFKGLRRDYMDAAHDWHARARGVSDLYLPQFPVQRPFRAPAEMGLGDAAPPASAFDILSDSALFDADWYALSHPDVLQADLSPVRHYLSSGARENRDPGPGFSTGGYRRKMALAAEDNPLLHYETTGRHEGAEPLPCFAGQFAARLEEGAPPCARRLICAHGAGKTLFGAERSLLDVVARMAARGDAPVVVLPGLQNTDYLERLLAVSAAVELAPQLWRRQGLSPHPQTVQRLRDLIRKYRVQDVHVNTLVLDAPLRAARSEGVPTVVHVRELPDQDAALCRALGTDAKTLRADLLDQADRFIVTSQVVADWLGCPERIEIRPNSVDEALFSLPFAPGPELNVAIISSNIAKKGLADFLAVARIVGQDGRPVRFRIFGPPTRDLHLMQPLPSNVVFCGYAETPAQAMAQADVVMSLSKFAESFGRTVMEAMAAGRPVICYDRGAPPTLVESGQSGFVVPADDPETAALAVMALDAARGQLYSFSRAARARAQWLQAQAIRP